MSYNPNNQYRCTIIRGKSISKMDDYLPIYLDILNDICPIAKSDFSNAFSLKMSKFISAKKTIDNHRTENVDKILGMITEVDGIIHLSDRTRNFISDNDQPAFFKSVCFRFQQPNGSQKIDTVLEKIKHKIRFRPYHFILALLKLADEQNTLLSKKDIAFYVLNSLEVLQGKYSPIQVLNKILSDKEAGIISELTINKNYARTYQHINEQLDYLELSNLIRKDNNNVWINKHEMRCIDFFIDQLKKPLEFNAYQYDLNNPAMKVQFYSDWNKYFCSISKFEKEIFATSIISLKDDEVKRVVINNTSTQDLGDEGEALVLSIEKNIVREFNKRLVNKVNHRGKTRGLGYDITSIEAGRNKQNPEYIRYIEVKSTKRVHPPSEEFRSLDTITMTRNEWVAAEQHADSFYLYRVYFTSQGPLIRIIHNPVKKSEDGVIYAAPISYRIEFEFSAIDAEIRV